MKFLLDTNVCIHLLNGTRPIVQSRLAQHQPMDVGLCAISVAELRYGARKSSRVSENLVLIERFCRPFISLPFDDACAASYGIIRADLERAGTPIGPNDLLIAATAAAHDLVLVTHNTREFGRIAGLQLTDWELGEG